MALTQSVDLFLPPQRLCFQEIYTAVASVFNYLSLFRVKSHNLLFGYSGISVDKTFPTLSSVFPDAADCLPLVVHFWPSRLIFKSLSG